MTPALPLLAEARELVGQVEEQAREADVRGAIWSLSVKQSGYVSHLARHISAWSPANVLALCEGWRETLDDAEAQAQRHSDSEGWCAVCDVEMPCHDAERAEDAVARVHGAAQRALAGGA